MANSTTPTLQHFFSTIPAPRSSSSSSSYKMTLPLHHTARAPPPLIAIPMAHSLSQVSLPPSRSPSPALGEEEEEGNGSPSSEPESASVQSEGDSNLTTTGIVTPNLTTTSTTSPAVASTSAPMVSNLSSSGTGVGGGGVSILNQNQKFGGIRTVGATSARRRKYFPPHPVPPRRGPKPKKEIEKERRRKEGRELVMPNIQVIVPNSPTLVLSVSYLSTPFSDPVPVRPVSILRSTKVTAFHYLLKEVHGVVRVAGRGVEETECRVPKRGRLSLRVAGQQEEGVWTVLD